MRSLLSELKSSIKTRPWFDTRQVCLGLPLRLNEEANEDEGALSEL
jgi:hypothetical protein